MREMLLEVLSEARSAWRFKWYGAAAAWLVALGGWGWVALQPDVYEATARVYVDMSSVLRPLLGEQIIPSDVGTRLAYVRQALLGRQYLERVVSEQGLDALATTPQERERMLNALRDAIRIDATAASRDAQGRESPSSIFDISYRHTRPQTATGVVTALVNSLIEDTLGANREGTDTAERFLDERIREYENRLQQAEQALADFQKRNSGRLPGSEGGYFVRMQSERDLLNTTQRNLRLAESRRNRLQEQLNGETAVTADDAAAVREPPPNSIDSRIRDNRMELDRLLLEYTDRHPDVIAVREALARLEAQRIEQLNALGLANPDQQLSTLGANPVYQAVQIALNEAEIEVATLTADAADRQRTLNELQSLIDEVPEVEAELARLNRDYDVVREQYQSLIQSRETQALSRKASDSDQVDFRVLNPPQAGYAPVAPPRLLFLAAVLVSALGVGGGLCYLVAQMRPVFNNSRALRETSNFPVLGVVGRVMVDATVRNRKRVEMSAFSATVAGLVCAFGVVVYVEVLGPGFRALLGVA